MGGLELAAVLTEEGDGGGSSTVGCRQEAMGRRLDFSVSSRVERGGARNQGGDGDHHPLKGDMAGQKEKGVGSAQREGVWPLVIKERHPVGSGSVEVGTRGMAGARQGREMECQHVGLGL
jgi:hypothetical protein